MLTVPIPNEALILLGTTIQRLSISRKLGQNKAHCLEATPPRGAPQPSANPLVGQSNEPQDTEDQKYILQILFYVVLIFLHAETSNLVRILQSGTRLSPNRGSKYLSLAPERRNSAPTQPRLLHSTIVQQ